MARERRVVGPVGADLPDVDLARAVGTFGKTLVRHDREPLVVGAELNCVLLRGGVVRELRHLARFDLDLVEVVLLVPCRVLAERDEAVVAAPSETGAHGPRHLAVTDLAHSLRRKVHHVELDAARFVPIEGDLVALPRDERKEERGQSAELLERDTRLALGHDGHGWSSPGCSLHSKQRARGMHRDPAWR